MIDLQTQAMCMPHAAGAGYNSADLDADGFKSRRVLIVEHFHSTPVLTLPVMR